MKSCKGQHLKYSDIFAGDLYYDNEYYGLGICVCVGKVLGSTDICFLRLETRRREYNYVEDVIEDIKRGYRVNDILRRKNFDSFCYIGHFMDADKLKSWIAQLALSGTPVKVTANTYIGNWDERKKLKTVKPSELEAGKWYVREEVAYYSHKGKNLTGLESVWFYVGCSYHHGVERYEWLETTAFFIPFFKNQTVITEDLLANDKITGKWHTIMVNYSDMVLLE